MPRVSELLGKHLTEGDREIFNRFISQYGPFENQAKIFAHRPPALRHMMGLLMELSEEEILPKRYLEIALVTVSKLNECEYCIVHHSPRMTNYGFGPEAVEGILKSKIPGFDTIDYLVRDYSVQVTKNSQNIKDAMFTKLRKHFNEAQIVELTLRISLCGFFNRFNDALQIPIEENVFGDLSTVEV